MFKFLGQFILLATAYLLFATILSSILCHCGLNRSRESVLSDIKLERAIVKQADFLILGSSRIHRHLDAEAVEAALANEYSVFNMGIPGMWPPRQDRFVLKALEETKPRVVVVELNAPFSLSSNFRSAETLRAITPETIKTSINTKLESSGSMIGKARFVASFAAAAAYKYLGIGLMRTEFFEYDSKTVESTMRCMDLAKAGFLPLDREQEFSSDFSQRAKPSLEGLAGRRDQNVKKYATMKASVSPSLLVKCRRLIERGEKQHCRVIFVLSPKLVSPQLEIVYPVFEELPDANKIDMSDPEKFPEFYDLAYSFDPGHLNEKGAVIFTKAFGLEVKKLFSQRAGR